MLNIIRQIRYTLFFLLLTGIIMAGCRKKDVIPDSSEITIQIISNVTTVEQLRYITLKTKLEHAGNIIPEYQWVIGDSLIGSADTLNFISVQKGTFTVKVQAIHNARILATDAVTITVTAGTQTLSPYIARVLEYLPAPGQFVNKMPVYDIGDNAATMVQKAGAAIAQNKQGMVSLGGYGGYIVVGFDHTIINVPDSADFKILGNAFWAASNPNPDAPLRGGSCEPGIVMVSADVNKNGLPDDEWYELAGSEYHKTATTKNYRITYYKPDEDKVRTPDNSYPYLNDTTYVKWTTNGYGNGYLYRNTFHNQSYWPQWISGNELQFTGTRLANNYIDESGNGTYFVQYAYNWGYADNAPNNDVMSNFRIEWAVDKNGQPVHLPGIDFIKVYTGVNQYAGWLGETSTEIMGINDLHLLK